MPSSDEPLELRQLAALILETFGLRLAAHLCASDEEDMGARLNGNAALSHAAEEVLTNDLVQLARFFSAQMATYAGAPRSLVLDALCEPWGSNSTLAAAIRLKAGAQDENLVIQYDRDLIVFSLARMAVDVYPLLLAPLDRGRPMIGGALWRHPMRKALQEALHSDIALGRLFPEEDPSFGRRGFLWNSFGGGGDIHDADFGQRVIASAWDEVAMLSARPSLRQLVDTVSRNVAVLRRVTNGESATVMVRIVFTGFSTEAECSVSTPWGALHPIQSWERDLAPASWAGLVEGSRDGGSPVAVSLAGEMVLDMAIPFCLSSVSPSIDLSNSDNWPACEGLETLQRRIEAVQLALTLSMEGREVGSWTAARLAWQWIADPLAPGRRFSRPNHRRSSPYIPAVLTARECGSFTDWLCHVKDGWSRQIDIAVRRFLRAVNSRGDPADRLVDSVIVWENLFGTSQGESTFRISAALAWLLAPDVESRLELQAQLKDIYTVRSRIVHGSKADEASLLENANNAVLYSRGALAKLLRDRRDILTLPNGSARSQRLIMGG